MMEYILPNNPTINYKPLQEVYQKVFDLSRLGLI